MKRIIFCLVGAICFLFSCEEDAVVADATEEAVDSLTLSDAVSVYDSLNFFDGYTLFAPLTSKNTYLVDMEGFVVHYWESDYTPGHSVHLLDDGRLLRTQSRGNASFSAGGSGGGLEIRSFDGELEWQYQYSGSQYCQHHDAIMLPNGNVLFIAWEQKTRAEALAAGRDESLVTDDGLWSEMILEITPTGDNGGEIVWAWHVWDHLVQDVDDTGSNYGNIAANPQRVDINYNIDTGTDMLHFNALEYIAAFDQVIVSSKAYSEIWVIDHSTTTAEAETNSGGTRGKGGDLLYRFGNPAAYDCGSEADQVLYGQHNPTWMDDLPGNGGNVLVFNNGQRKNRATALARLK